MRYQYPTQVEILSQRFLCHFQEMIGAAHKMMGYGKYEYPE
jgi:hypothetical protein